MNFVNIMPYFYRFMTFVEKAAIIGCEMELESYFSVYTSP